MRDSHCHVGLLINCTTDITEEEMLTYLEALYEDRQDADNLFSVIRNLQREQEVYQSKEGLYETEEDIVYFRPSEIKALKRMREAIPEMTRASKLRGFTSSTDVNCRLTSESEQERERAYKAIMETYWMYINDLRDRDFRFISTVIFIPVTENKRPAAVLTCTCAAPTFLKEKTRIARSVRRKPGCI